MIQLLRCNSVEKSKFPWEIEIPIVATNETQMQIY